jgi:HK97 family phage prohead protease
MPYFIAKNRVGCESGWAVVDDTGDLVACHDSKQGAIDNAVALSIATDEPFEGERAVSVAVGDYVTWLVDGETQTGEVYSIDEETAQVKIYDDMGGFFVETVLITVVPIADLTKIDQPEVFDEEDQDEDRAINQEAPAYMRAAARRGLEYYEQGLAGDGLVDRTVREARDMAEGRVTDDKWVRIAAWIARHMGDLDSPDADPTSENYPSAGVVAHLLWGSGPGKRAAERTMAYAESVVARIEAEQERDAMTVDVRSKWVDVAHRIKAQIEGGTVEGRAKNEPEQRVNVADFEVRETPAGMTFTGYAAVFNSDSVPLPFTERIAPGAFKRSLQSRNEVKLLWNHDAGEPLASVRGGTLKLTEDERGLKVEATLANTTRGRDVSELIRSKTVDSMSFGFSVIKDSWSGDVRTLQAVRLFEVSIVSSPAYEGTAGTVAVRSTTGIDADQLADALMRLESGEDLDPTQATLITDVVSKLTKTEEVQEVQGDILALKKKKLDLLLKEI